MIRKQINNDKYYLRKTLNKIMAKYPMTGEPKPREVETFAKNLCYRMEKRSPLVFRWIRLMTVWQDTIDFLTFHKLDNYIARIIERQDAWLTKGN